MKAESCTVLSEENKVERFTRYLKNTVEQIVDAEASGDYSKIIYLSASAIQNANTLADLKSDKEQQLT